MFPAPASTPSARTCVSSEMVRRSAPVGVAGAGAWPRRDSTKASSGTGVASMARAASAATSGGRSTAPTRAAASSIGGGSGGASACAPTVVCARRDSTVAGGFTSEVGSRTSDISRWSTFTPPAAG